MMSAEIILLGGENPTTWIVYNELVARFGVFPAFIEKPISRWSLVKNRIRKLGLTTVASQLVFALLVRPLLLRRSAARISYIKRLHSLEAFRPAGDSIIQVDNVNSEACLQMVQSRAPKVVIVNGTRILNKKTLSTLNATVINTHQGITPFYRGAHGAYWALAQNDPTNCGVTVHLVDEGIDTGNIIAQAIIEPEQSDNFTTYPYLQTASALEPLVAAVRHALGGTLSTKPISGMSKVWYHPGVLTYFSNAWRGVW